MSDKKPLLSFHGNPAIKEKYVQRVKKHAEMDEIIQGTGFENNKGCAVGCTLDRYSHDGYQTELGIFWPLAYVEDTLFEAMPLEEAKKFPLQFLEALPVGVNTDLIWKNFVLWNLADENEGLLKVMPEGKPKEAIQKVVELYRRSLTEVVPVEEWRKLASASAYASAYAYAYASASASAYAYAYAYAYASAYASASAYAYASALQESGDTRPRSVIYNERILRLRDKLLELFSSAK